MGWDVMKYMVVRNNSKIEDQLTIYVKYLPGAHQLEQVDWGSWIDLYTYEEVTLKQGDQKYINLGLAMKLPDGYEAIMAPRSSTYKNWGITQTNSIGVIDSTYCGNDDIWMFPAYASKNITIPAETRICQFRIQKEQPKIIFQQTNSLKDASRGGLGSSGL